MTLNLVLIGPPGAGKGTIAKVVAKDLGLPHLSTGDMFREAISSGSSLGNKVKLIVESGALVDDETVAKVVEERLSQQDCANGFLLDGYPRNKEQAITLDNILKKVNKKIDFAIQFVVSDETLLKRLSGRFKCEKCGKDYNIMTLQKPKIDGICDDCGGKLIQRKDDLPETIKKRIEIYKEKAKPLIDFYEVNNKLKNVNAEGSVQENVDRMKKVLGV